jgi:hypothetical protein
MASLWSVLREVAWFAVLAGAFMLAALVFLALNVALSALVFAILAGASALLSTRE